MKSAPLLLISLFAYSAHAENYYCILAQVKDSVPLKFDRKTGDLAGGPIALTLDNGITSTIETVKLPATEYTPATTMLSVSLSVGVTNTVDALYDSSQSHTFLKQFAPVGQASVQCYKR